jgi:hypothetical protein
MPVWIILALSIVFGLWSVVEVLGLRALATMPGVRYSAASALATMVWFVCLIFGGCYLVSRLFV